MAYYTTYFGVGQAFVEKYNTKINKHKIMLLPKIKLNCKI